MVADGQGRDTPASPASCTTPGNRWSYPTSATTPATSAPSKPRRPRRRHPAPTAVGTQIAPFCTGPGSRAAVRQTAPNGGSARGYLAVGGASQQSGMAYWMVACSVYLYIAILGANARFCRDEVRRDHRVSGRQGPAMRTRLPTMPHDTASRTLARLRTGPDADHGAWSSRRGHPHT